jgi:hypothetical protein
MNLQGVCCRVAMVALVVLPATAGARQALRAPTSSPVVVAELFTSEGCSSCPPADVVLRELADGSLTPGITVIALGEHVDYWDHEGWRDPFSSALFSARQTDYDARVFHANTIYTPQLVIDGQTQLIGSERAKVRAAVAAAARQSKIALAVRARRSLDGSNIDVTVAGSAVERRSDLVLAVTEDGLMTDVKAGENGGRRLSHTGVVRLLRSTKVEAGDLTRDLVIPFDRHWNPAHLSVVALLQDRASRRVVGAGSVPLGVGAGTSH